MGSNYESVEWQPVLELYETLTTEIVERLDRATRHADFILPSDKSLDLRCIYPDAFEDAMGEDQTLQAIDAQPVQHVNDAEDRAERIRTRRTVIALSAIAWCQDPPHNTPPTERPDQIAA